MTEVIWQVKRGILTPLRFIGFNEELTYEKDEKNVKS
jgi:hypothetical protein